LSKYIMIKGIHIEPTNICVLKCSECQRTKFIKQWPQHWRNHSIDIDQLMAFLDLDLRGLRVLLCGNLGDPIYHPRFLDLVIQIKQRGARINITTNGSYHDQDWWQSLCGALDAQDLVEFSVDGVPENFRIYRENADWNSILLGMQTCVQNGIDTAWKYIPFEFNEHTIEQARTMSQQIGIATFHVSKSWRFNQQTARMPKQIDLISAKKFMQPAALSKKNLKVDPLCRSGQGNSHFISAAGFYSPCCMLSDHNWYYKTMFGKQRSDYDIRTTTLSQILQAPKVVQFYQNITSDPIVACQYQCAAVVDL